MNEAKAKENDEKEVVMQQVMLLIPIHKHFTQCDHRHMLSKLQQASKMTDAYKTHLIWCRICMPNYCLLPCLHPQCRVLQPSPHQWAEWACLQCRHNLACHQWGRIDVSELRSTRKQDTCTRGFIILYLNVFTFSSLVFTHLEIQGQKGRGITTHHYTR